MHDDQGAQAWRSYQIQFDPSSQRVEVLRARVHREGGSTLDAVRTFERQLGQPWYRIYYDTRALVVVFPDIEAGDVVELQYRVDDVAHSNLFADYYGGIQVLQRYNPIRRFDYVLITPESRSFYFNEPDLPSLQRDERVHDGHPTGPLFRKRDPRYPSRAGNAWFHGSRALLARLDLRELGGCRALVLGPNSRSALR